MLEVESLKTHKTPNSRGVKYIAQWNSLLSFTSFALLALQRWPAQHGDRMSWVWEAAVVTLMI